ncbi:hypothetical protein O6H91_23G038200 [Diphasiastrum complanatum]|uniref:Uncharacterized protein n=2 Tax=Diphasiastrum complanatum TaxID=34168 RepID=A0ACC2A9T0_DIPCM|nr:hypothetical protein O6H91_23G038200 [Diphasiastrum complanatum]KAJ7514308.1 hypothetical protein O6H91_23G038200 [Diphasiastrum complanatum]
MGGSFSKRSRRIPYENCHHHHSCSSSAPIARPAATLNKRLSKKYSHISDQFTSVEQVQQALSRAGLESSNLIVGIDFTKSNEWTGKLSFNGHSLHTISDVPNPYEQALSIIGRTLSAFDEDNMIPCFGFGDASTHDQSVFSFYPDHRPCMGFSEALERYRAIVPHIRLAGPTSFAPIVESAMNIVEESGGQYHVLLIIADGQVTRSIDTEPGRLSPQERNTIDAIVSASNYPLSIVLVGVGDGPWDMMKEFDDNIPSRGFDNFQFVNFTSIMARNLPFPQKEALFALSALMEIPSQYAATLELNILGRTTGVCPKRTPLPPPQTVLQADSAVPRFPHSTSLYTSRNQPSTDYSYGGFSSPDPLNDFNSQSSDQLCPVCFAMPKDLAFNCGHQTCQECGRNLSNCPICRQMISARIKLY